MIRPYHPSDRPALDRFFERNGNPWSFPDPEHPKTMEVFVMEEDGEVKALLAGVAVLEVCLAVERTDRSKPSERLSRCRAIIEEGCRWAYSQGFAFAYTPVPKALAGWARKLRRFVGVVDDDRIHGTLDIRERFEWSLSSPLANESKTSG